MSVVKILVEENTPIKDITELPPCERCGNRVATVPIEIADTEYLLCVPCSVQPPEWSIPTR